MRHCVAIIGICYLSFTCGCQKKYASAAKTANTPAKESTARINHFKHLASEFWKEKEIEHRNTPVRALKPRQQIDASGLNLTSKEAKIVIDKAKRFSDNQSPTEYAQERWKDAQNWKALEQLEMAEKARLAASLTTKQIGMDDVTVGRIIATHHEKIARTLWMTVQYPEYQHVPGNEPLKPMPNRRLLYTETRRFQKQPYTITVAFGETTNYPLPPLTQSLQTIDHHLKKAGLTRRDIGITLDAIAKIIARQ